MIKNFIKENRIFIIILIISIFTIRPSVVLGESMQPTLQNHNVLITEKLSTLNDSYNYGDIITFKTNLKINGTDSTKVLIKRVIGLEGDIITINKGNVFRNGQQLVEPYIGINITYGDGSYIVPQNCLFVLGDNRENSCDSRNPNVGFVNVNQVTGVVYLRLLPIDELSTLK